MKLDINILKSSNKVYTNKHFENDTTQFKVVFIPMEQGRKVEEFRQEIKNASRLTCFTFMSCRFMITQTVAMGECFLTQGTLVWFLPSVSSFVRPQTIWTGEHFSTH